MKKVVIGLGIGVALLFGANTAQSLQQGACKLLQVYQKCATTMAGKNTPQNCQFISSALGASLKTQLTKQGYPAQQVDGAVKAVTNACYAGCIGDQKVLENLKKLCQKK
jgi:hypothetical protein